jgi:hypothetical protein
MDLPVTFDDAVVDYSLIGFGGVEGSTINISNIGNKQSCQSCETCLSETWAGTTIPAAGLGFKNKILFN